MAVITYAEPKLSSLSGLASPLFDRVIPGQNVTFRRGALLQNTTTGSIVLPAATGSMAALAGPPLSAITFGTAAQAGAPAQTYYHYFAYSATSNESLASGPYLQNVPAGFKPTVNVAAAGAPAAATNYVVYTGVTPTFRALQNTSRTTTALGAAFTLAYPLTNSIGAAAVATNVASGIIGIADADSDANFFSGPGGSLNVNNKSLFGATQSFPPLDSLGALAIPMLKLNIGLWEFSLVQAWDTSLLNTNAGILLDATTGWHVVDTSQSNAVCTIRGLVVEPSPFSGGPGDTGTRVQVQFLAAALA